MAGSSTPRTVRSRGERVRRASARVRLGAGGLATALLAACLLVLAAPQAHAAGCADELGAPRCDEVELYGHRCKHWDDNKQTSENTVFALRLVARAGAGTGCEIDAWRLADGEVVVHHDSTWLRTIDPATRRGVPREVRLATWAQVRSMRTNGGAPVATLRQMIREAGANGVPLIVDVKNFPVTRSWVQYAAQRGARVSWYQPLAAARQCTAPMLAPARAAGATVGVKGMRGTCESYNAATLPSRGYSFFLGQTTVWQPWIDAGLRVGPFNSDSTPEEARRWLELGTDILITRDVVPVLAWLGRG